jgi:hypothetical protein
MNRLKVIVSSYISYQSYIVSFTTLKHETKAQEHSALLHPNGIQ